MSNLTPEKQILIYMGRLRDELNTAYTHYEIAKTIRGFRRTHHSEFSEAITFFQVTQNANLFATVMAICRFIDSSTHTMQLNSFFNLLRNNLDLFTIEAYKQRLKDNGKDDEYIEDFAQKHSAITKEIVDEDEASIESLPITNIKRYRNKRLAHLDRGLALKEVDILQENPVMIHEIDDILSALDKILNRYGIAYDGSEWSIGLPPVKDQMEYVMDSIKFHRESRRRLK